LGGFSGWRKMRNREEPLARFIGSPETHSKNRSTLAIEIVSKYDGQRMNHRKIPVQVQVHSIPTSVWEREAFVYELQPAIGTNTGSESNDNQRAC